MKKENFDEILKETLREYVKNTESEPDEKIKFSKRHERKMEQIFRAIENGTLGNFEIDENVSEKLKENNERSLSEFSGRFAFKRVAKAAIIVLLGLVASLAFAPGMEAWKTDDLNLYEDETGEYAWVLPNDISEVLDPKVGSGEEYLEIFGWLPEGAEIEAAQKSKFALTLNIKLTNGTNLILKALEDEGDLEMDLKNTEAMLILNDNLEVLYTFSNNRISMFWSVDDKKYKIYGELAKEEMMKIIESINYKKINEIL